MSGTDSRPLGHPDGPPPTAGRSAAELLVARDRAFLQRLDAHIDRAFADGGFGTAHLAERLGMSERHLRRRVQDLAGETPGVRLRRRRVEAGAALLATGLHTVAEVAGAVGYGGAEGFRRAFVALRGHQPSEMARSAPLLPEP